MILFFFLVGPIGYEFFYTGILENAVHGWECMIIFWPFFYYIKKKLQKLFKIDGFIFIFIEFIYKFNLFLVIWCYIIFGLSLLNLFYGIDVFTFYNYKIHGVFFTFLHEPVIVIINFYGNYFSRFVFFLNNFDILFLQWFNRFVNKNIFILLFMIVVNLMLIVLSCIKLFLFVIGKFGVIAIKYFQFVSILMDFISMLITNLLIFLGLKDSWQEIFKDVKKIDKNNKGGGAEKSNDNVGNDNFGGDDL